MKQQGRLNEFLFFVCLLNVASLPACLLVGNFPPPSKSHLLIKQSHLHLAPHPQFLICSHLSIKAALVPSLSARLSFLDFPAYIFLDQHYIFLVLTQLAFDLLFFSLPRWTSPAFCHWLLHRFYLSLSWISPAIWFPTLSFWPSQERSRGLLKREVCFSPSVCQLACHAPP